MVLKKMLLGALGWYLVFTFLYFATLFSGIQYYSVQVTNSLANILVNIEWLWSVVSEDILGNIWFIGYASTYLLCLFCASVVGVILIEGRICSLKETITATLCWLWYLVGVVMIFSLWHGEYMGYALTYLLGMVPITDNTHEELVQYTMITSICESIIAVPTAILGAFTYCGLRKWSSRDKSQGIKV